MIQFLMIIVYIFLGVACWLTLGLLTSYIMYWRRKLTGLSVKLNNGQYSESSTKKFKAMGCYMACENRDDPTNNDDDLGHLAFYFGPISLIIMFGSWVVLWIIPIFLLLVIKFLEGIFRIKIWDNTFNNIFNSNL